MLWSSNLDKFRGRQDLLIILVMVIDDLIFKVHGSILQLENLILTKAFNQIFQLVQVLYLDYRLVPLYLCPDATPYRMLSA